LEQSKTSEAAKVT